MNRLTGLDALRGIAALMVLVFHVGILDKTGRFGGGFLAVDFFFVLSGYIMARTYEDRMPSATAFFRIRYRRLWPTMALGMLLGAPFVVVAWGANGLLVSLLNLALIPAFTSVGSFPGNGPAWSIFAELTANLWHALWGRALSTPRLIVFALLAGATISLPMVLNPALNNPGPGVGLNVLWAIPRALFGYTLGIILWRRWGDRPLLAPKWPLAFFMLGLVLIYGGQVPVALPFFVLLFCPIIIAAGLNWEAGAAGYWLGAMSFPLYAIQIPVLRWGGAFGVSPPVAAVVAVILSLGMAWVPWKIRRLQSRRISTPLASLSD